MEFKISCFKLELRAKKFLNFQHFLEMQFWRENSHKGNDKYFSMLNFGAKIQSW